MNSKLFIKILCAVSALVILTFCPLHAAQISLQAMNGQWVCAENGGGREVVANRGGIGGWEVFTLSDANGGNLENGDEITIQASNGQYFCAEGGGGQAVVANRDGVGGWEVFHIYKLNGGGAINSGDAVAIQAWNGQYWCAEGGGGSVVNANRDGVGGWESFTFITDGGGGGGNANPQTNWLSANNTAPGQATTFTGNASDPDGNLKVLHFYVSGPGLPGWNHVGSANISGGNATGSINWTPSQAGDYAVHIRAQDSWDAYDSNGNVVAYFTAAVGSQPPTVRARTSATSINFGQSLAFYTDANDPDGTLSVLDGYVRGPSSGYSAPNWDGWWCILWQTVSPASSATASVNFTPTGAGVWQYHANALDATQWASGDISYFASWDVWANSSNAIAANFTVNKTTPAASFPGVTFAAGPVTVTGAMLNATFSNPYSGAVAQPTGSVTYAITAGGAGNPLGQTLGVGFYTITATYLGDGNYNATSINSTFQIQSTDGNPANGSEHSRWLDVNGDGIRDEVIAANTNRFSYTITSWSTDYYDYWGYDPNDYWSYNLDLDYWLWNNFSYGLGDGYGGPWAWYTYYWNPSWYYYPSYSYTITYSDIRCNIQIESGYTYRLYMGPADGTGGPSTWTVVPGFAGNPNGDFTMPSGQQSLFFSNLNMDYMVGKIIHLVRLGKPIGGLSITSGIGGTSITTGGGGTISVPGLGTVTLSGTGTVGSSPIFSIHDILDKIIQTGPQIVWTVWDLVSNTQLSIGGTTASLGLGVDLHGNFLIGARLDDGPTLFYRVNVLNSPSIHRSIAGTGDYGPVAGDRAKVMIGQRVDLRVVPPSGQELSDVQWSIPNRSIKSYLFTQASSSVIEISAQQLSQSEITFYWLDPGAKTVTVNCKIGGQSFSTQTTIDVYAPDATLATTLGTARLNDARTRVGLFSDADSVDGIVFTGNVTVPQNLPSTLQGGGWCFLQTITVALTAIDHNGVSMHSQFNGIHSLDTVLPYEPVPTTDPYYLPYYPISLVDGTTGPKTASDAPSMALIYDTSGPVPQTLPFRRVSFQNESFSMYMMYQPGGIGSIFVPLKVVNWSFSITVNRDESWSVVPGTTNQSAATAISTFVPPVWNSVIYPTALIY